MSGKLVICVVTICFLCLTVANNIGFKLQDDVFPGKINTPLQSFRNGKEQHDDIYKGTLNDDGVHERSSKNSQRTKRFLMSGMLSPHGIIKTSISHNRTFSISSTCISVRIPYVHRPVHLNRKPTQEISKRRNTPRNIKVLWKAQRRPKYNKTAYHTQPEEEEAPSNRNNKITSNQ